MKRKTLLFVGVITVIAALGLYIAFALGYFSPFWNALKQKIRSGQTTVYIHELTEFEWDKMCALHGYVLGVGPHFDDQKIAEYIEGDLGPFRDKLPPLDGDGQWAFVFIRDGAVVEIIERGRGYYVDRDYQDNCIERGAAKFLVRGKNIRINDNIGWRK